MFERLIAVFGGLIEDTKTTEQGMMMGMIYMVAMMVVLVGKNGQVLLN